jgi:hypothetical protein
MSFRIDVLKVKLRSTSNYIRIGIDLTINALCSTSSVYKYVQSQNTLFDTSLQNPSFAESSSKPSGKVWANRGTATRISLHGTTPMSVKPSKSFRDHWQSNLRILGCFAAWGGQEPTHIHTLLYDSLGRLPRMLQQRSPCGVQSRMSLHLLGEVRFWLGLAPPLAAHAYILVVASSNASIDRHAPGGE